MFYFNFAHIKRRFEKLKAQPLFFKVSISLLFKIFLDGMEWCDSYGRSSIFHITLRYIVGETAPRCLYWGLSTRYISPLLQIRSSSFREDGLDGIFYLTLSFSFSYCSRILIIRGLSFYSETI